MREKEPQINSFVFAKCNKCDFTFRVPFEIGDKIDFEASRGEVEDMADLHEVNTFDTHSVTIRVKHP